MYAYITNLDNFVDVQLKMTIVVLSMLVLILNGVSLAALLQTRNTPKRARFLSAVLLLFDFLSTLLYTVRKFISDAKAALVLQDIALGCSYCAYINIAIMSLERLLIFQWPMFYLRYARFLFVKIFCVSVLSVYVVIYTVDNAMCYVYVDVTDESTLFCFERVIIQHALVTFTLTTVVSCLTLGRILFIIQKQQNKNIGIKGNLRQQKSTVCVLCCCGNYLVTTLMCMLLAFVVKENYLRRLIIDCVLTLNGFVDMCVYVLWYKECRLKVLQMLAMVCPSLDKRVEKMRMTIFEIMTYDHKTPTST